MALAHSREEHDKTDTSMGMAVPQLLTPEEPLLHTFVKVSTLPPIQTASPPASPEFRSFDNQASFEEQPDHVLYPNHNTEQQLDQRPLFDGHYRSTSPGRQQSPGTESSLSVTTPASQHDSPFQHIQSLPKQPKTVAIQAHHETQADLVGPVALLNTYGLDYWRYCVAQSEEHRRMLQERKLPPLGAHRGTGRDRYTQQVVSSLGRSRVEKPRDVLQATPRSRVAKTASSRAPARADASPSLPKGDSHIKRRRRQTSTPDLNTFSQLVREPKPRTRAAPSKKIDDKEPEEWAELPDHCPPISSLDDMSKKLTVSWSNANALDLSKDVDRDQLHPQELEIAQVLRLKCNQYLANKRRIFAAKVAALREGKEFNKTSAQTCTKIDVNKASRLWAAFDGVGWFEEKWYTQWL